MLSMNAGETVSHWLCLIRLYTMLSMRMMEIVRMVYLLDPEMRLLNACK